jgi:hypothetical protein
MSHICSCKRDGILGGDDGRGVTFPRRCPTVPNHHQQYGHESLARSGIKAKNSKEAITITEAEGPELIFMDMELPDVDGVSSKKSP